MKFNFSNLNKLNLNRLTKLIFLIKLNLFAIPLYAIMSYNPNMRLLENFIAIIVKSILQLFGYVIELGEGFESEGLIPVLTIQGLDYGIGIGNACTSYRSIMALSALILATPSNNKIKPLLTYLPILFVLNIVRIITTIFVGILLNKKFFDITHNLLWREGLIIIVLFLYYQYLKGVKK